MAVLAASREDGEASVQEESPANYVSTNRLDVVDFGLQRALDDCKSWNKIKRREPERQFSEEAKGLPQDSDHDQSQGGTDSRMSITADQNEREP